LTERQRRLVTFAEKLTCSPQAVEPADTAALVDILGDDGEAVEAATVVAGFNFANRVADALDVPRELPAVFERWTIVRAVAMTLMGVGIRLRMQMHRNVPRPPAEALLDELRRDAQRVRMGTVPPYFERLRVRPHILAGQIAICRTVLLASGFPRATVLRIGSVISTLNGDHERVADIARVLTEDARGAASSQGDDDVPPALEREMLQLARDVTVDATAVTDEQVASLRRNLGDIGVLNLVLLCAAYNGGNRLSRALGDASTNHRVLADAPAALGSE